MTGTTLANRAGGYVAVCWTCERPSVVTGPGGRPVVVRLRSHALEVLEIHGRAVHAAEEVDE